MEKSKVFLIIAALLALAGVVYTSSTGKVNTATETTFDPEGADSITFSEELERERSITVGINGESSKSSIPDVVQMLDDDEALIKQNGKWSVNPDFSEKVRKKRNVKINFADHKRISEATNSMREMLNDGTLPNDDESKSLLRDLIKLKAGLDLSSSKEPGISSLDQNQRELLILASLLHDLMQEMDASTPKIGEEDQEAFFKLKKVWIQHAETLVPLLDRVIDSGAEESKKHLRFLKTKVLNLQSKQEQILRKFIHSNKKT